MTKQPRILIFATNYLPNVGGAEIAVDEITKRTPDISFDLIAPLLSRRLPREERIGNVTVYRVGLGFWLDKFAIAKLGLLKALTLHRRHRYDAIWSLMASQASVAATFFKILHPRTPLLLTLQEGDEEEHLKRYVLGNTLLYKVFIQPWHTAVFHRADIISVISSYLAVRARAHNKRAPIVIVPNGVSIEHFSRPRGSEVLAAVRRELGIEKNVKLLITVSRLVKKNAVEDVIRALTLLPSEIHLMVIGSGSDERKLQALAAETKVADRIHFLGHIPHDELPPYLQAASVFIRPSISEGMGNVFIEAMAAGVPVVATQVGGISDFLFDPEKNPGEKSTGRAVSVHAPEEIAHRVQHYLEYKEETKTIVANAKALVQSRYDWDTIAREMQEKVFSRLVQ